jgi:hypothetical protein
MAKKPELPRIPGEMNFIMFRYVEVTTRFNKAFAQLVKLLRTHSSAPRVCH